MAQAVDSQRPRKRLSLIEGRQMHCPRCKKPRDILAWIPLMQIEEFAHETCPIYKCPDCRWVFAPAPTALEDFL